MNELPKTIKPGVEVELQIAPYGEYRCHDGTSTGVMQHITPAAVEAMVANLSGEILVDYDHDSTDGRSEAAAWVLGLRNDPELGLMGTFRFTDYGAAAVNNRRYRFVSAEWEVDVKTGEPVRLTSVALTNKPNLPVRPMLNSNKAGGQTPAHAPQPTHNNNKDNSPMEKIKELLGLSPEATDAEVADVIAALQASIKTLTDKAADEEAEKFAAANSADEDDKKLLKNAYRQAPEVAKSLVTLLNRQKTVTVANSATAKPARPSFVIVKNLAPNALEQYDAMTDGPAKRAFLCNNAQEINRLRNAAQSK